MYKKLIILSIITLLWISKGKTKTTRYIELGINQSQFRNESCKSKIGPSIGMGFNYYPINSCGLFVGSGLVYQNKRMLLEGRTWPSTLEPEYASWIITGDLDISILYLEVPLTIGYSFRVLSQFSSSSYAGYSFSFPLKDNTRHTENEIREIKPDERGTHNFDYLLVDESGVSWSNNYHIGFRFSYSRFALTTSYVRALSFTKDIEGINIKSKLDSYKISFAVTF